MADKAKKITELTAATTLANTDVLVLVANTSGTAATKKITANNLYNNVPSNIVPTSNTQSFGSATKTWQYAYVTNVVFPGNNGTQTVAYDSGLLRVSNTATLTPNNSTRYLICDPNAAGGNVTITLPAGNYNGKTFVIKNINTGSYGINVQLANNTMYLEDTSGSLVQTFTISSSHDYAEWVWDSAALTYRILGHNI